MRHLLSPMLAFALVACSAVGPDYRLPEQAAFLHPASNAAFLSGDESVYATKPPAAAWWRLYDDAELNALVQEALAANTDLRVARANVAKSQAGFEYAEAARQPTTSLGFAPGFSRRSAEEELKGNVPLSSHWTYGLGAGVSYQVDLFGQISRTIEGAQADVGAARATYDTVRITIVAETTRAYLDACSAGREMAVARRLVDLQAHGTALTERLQKGGRAISLDVVRSSSLEDQVRASLPALQAKKQLAVYRLATLTGHPPGEFSNAAQACAQEPRLATAIPIGDGESLLRRRPDIRRAESELRAATARIGVATADLYPKVTLGASIGSVGLAKDFLDAGTLKFSIGPLVTWQFPDRSRRWARVHAAKADETAAYARFDGAVLGALRETESALTVYARDLDARRLLEAARRSSVEAAADTERMFVSGKLGYLAVLDANRNAIALEQAVAAADSKLASEQVTLFLALGGGWEECAYSLTADGPHLQADLGPSGAGNAAARWDPPTRSCKDWS